LEAGQSQSRPTTWGVLSTTWKYPVNGGRATVETPSAVRHRPRPRCRAVVGRCGGN